MVCLFSKSRSVHQLFLIICLSAYLPICLCVATKLLKGENTEDTISFFLECPCCSSVYLFICHLTNKITASGVVQVVWEKGRLLISHITKLVRSHPTLSFFPLAVPSEFGLKKAKSNVENQINSHLCLLLLLLYLPHNHKGEEPHSRTPIHPTACHCRHQMLPHAKAVTNYYQQPPLPSSPPWLPAKMCESRCAATAAPLPLSMLPSKRLLVDQ